MEPRLNSRNLKFRNKINKKKWIMISLIILVLLAATGYLFRKELSVLVFNTLLKDDVKTILDKSYKPVGYEKTNPKHSKASLSPCCFSELISVIRSPAGQIPSSILSFALKITRYYSSPSPGILIRISLGEMFNLKSTPPMPTVEPKWRSTPLSTY